MEDEAWEWAAAGSPAGVTVIRMYVPVEVLVGTASRLLLGWADGDPGAAGTFSELPWRL